MDVFFRDEVLVGILLVIVFKGGREGVSCLLDNQAFCLFMVSRTDVTRVDEARGSRECDIFAGVRERIVEDGTSTFLIVGDVNDG